MTRDQSHSPDRSACRRVLGRTTLLLILLILGPGWATVLASDAYDERRMRTGAKLFRSLLAADLHLEDKVDGEGHLRVLIFGNDTDTLEEARALIGAPDQSGRARLKGMALDLEDLHGVPDPADDGPVGVFLAEPPDERLLDTLIAWGIRKRVIVYSPFEGHVERGALGGVSIEAKVRPYINRRTLDAAEVELKPFFLKVSKVYE